MSMAEAMAPITAVAKIGHSLRSGRSFRPRWSMKRATGGHTM
jgi:hypothetical protein